MKRLDSLPSLTAISIVIAIASTGCDSGNRIAVFDPDPHADDAGLTFDAGQDVSEAPFPAPDGGDGGAIVDAGHEDSEPPDPDADGSDGEAGLDAGLGDASLGCTSIDDCDDGIACTVDACENGVCRHFLSSGSGPSACPVGQYCDPSQGCVHGIVCANDSQCEEALGGDPCKTHIYCHGPTATCQFSILDKDGDGHPPIACGGDDCDDTDPFVHPGQPEICDGKDNDCNGLIDEGGICGIGCDLPMCPEPQYPGSFRCCTTDGTCGFKTLSGPCNEMPPNEKDTCGLASCPEPTYADFFKCCTSADMCGYKNGPSGFCYDAEEPDPIDGGGGFGGGGFGGGTP